MNHIPIVVAGMFFALALAAPSEATVNSCAAAKRLCVAKHAAAVLKCHAKAAKPPGTDGASLTACLQKADAKFDGGAEPSMGCFEKLEAKYGIECLTSDDTDTLGTTTETYVGSVTCQLDPGFGTCPCTDGIQNGDETDVDCGGSKCPVCGLGEQCTEPTDCGATTTCGGSSCVCDAGRADCNASSADACEITTTNDLQNCGACNHVCATTHGTPGCVASQCTVSACDAGYLNCDGSAANGCECGSQNASAGCGAGSQCTLACFIGFNNCDGNVTNGCETNTRTSSMHCGVCNNACLPGRSCVNGSCL